MLLHLLSTGECDKIGKILIFRLISNSLFELLSRNELQIDGFLRLMKRIHIHTIPEIRISSVLSL